MNNFEDFDEEAARFELIQKMELAKSCDKDAIRDLDTHLNLIPQFLSYHNNPTALNCIYINV